MKITFFIFIFLLICVGVVLSLTVFFPIKNIDIVKEKLKNECINYIIVEDKIIDKYVSSFNKYDTFNIDINTIFIII